MSLKFKGDDEQSIDGKGRVAIPLDFREVIFKGDTGVAHGGKPEFHIVFGTEQWNHVRCYTKEEMARIDERIELLDEGSKNRQALEWVFHGRSTKVAMGDDGRVVLPPKVRKKLDLDGELYFMGFGNHFKIWKLSTYEASEAQKGDALVADLGPDFELTSLLPKLPPKTQPSA